MPDDLEVIREGIRCRRAGDRRKAREIFEQVLLRNPLQTWARYELIDELLEQDELDLAVEVAVQGVNLPTTSPHLICQLAEIMGKCGRSDEQRKYLKLATVKFPRRAYPWIQLAMTLFKEGKKLEAEQALADAHLALRENAQKDLISEAMAQIKTIGSRQKINTEVWPPIEGAAIKNACVVQMLKDEADIIRDQLEYNFRLGFRLFCIIDNNSSDRTSEKISEFIEAYPDAVVVVIHDRIKQLYQDFKTSAAAKFAAEYFKPLGYTIDWIFPLDADEFISLSSQDRCLNDILEASSNARVIALQLFNCASEEPLQEYPYRGIYTCFPLIDLMPERGVIKCAYKYSHDARPTLGNHFVINTVDSLEQIVAGSDFGLYIRHFPYRSISHAKSKVVNGYKALVEHPDVKGGVHWRQNWELYKKHGDPWIERHLLGYIKRVRNQNS